MIDPGTLADFANHAHAMVAGATSAINPVTLLYSALGATYGGASFAAFANDHHTLCRCYVISAVLHGLIGACHHLHL